jgi:nitroimidazol reductase NimA-like FMN-containing flavoprotein (pyridoxamine 5'-phosphate oxidase superfamily)
MRWSESTDGGKTMRRREKEIQNPKVLEELLHEAQVCRLGLAPRPVVGERNRLNTDTSHTPHLQSGYPYVVPVHFVHAEGRIYIHSARRGRKIEMLERNPRVCLEIDEFLGLKSADRACDYGTRFRSLIVFGTGRIVEEPEKKCRALRLFTEKYSGISFDLPDREIEGVAIIEIHIEEVTGKQG